MRYLLRLLRRRRRKADTIANVWALRHLRGQSR